MTDKNAYLDDDSSAANAEMMKRMNRPTTKNYRAPKEPKAATVAAPVAAPVAPVWPFRPEPKVCAHQEAVDELASVVTATQAALTKVFGTAPSPYIAVQAATAILDRAKNSATAKVQLP
jgi:hypothetical protein